ncbi:MAG: DUF2723 domain-containing protein [Muribaculaceae bacterium]|nr:DUF2723 domain-containing protein [Muribaculaceae bacterium]
MITHKYNLINNIGGWVVFVIALATYWLTLEPTASYWDCGEFIIQADKLEVGHPPGNPIFMLTARFFANFAPGQEYVSVMVNAMSGLLSALTILLLFWTISHLVRRLTVRDDERGELSLTQYLIIMGSAAVGSLAYCWSDTFWFSAVEGEVYAFSSFCTALVFWLILKWENRADDASSDRYLILIAYIIGVSIAVHLLNLLCIPAIVLVYAYRKYSDMNLVKSLIALLISFAIVVLVLYGLAPGFVKVAQVFELFCVNTLGWSFNSGAIIYGVVALCVFGWSIYALSRGESRLWVNVSFLLSVLMSGMLFFAGAWVGWLLLLALGVFLFTKYGERVSRRVLNITMWSIMVIFVGYSSYALILIRSTADTPMNQNSPDNVFDLAAYLSREQYGENPLIYGETMYSSPVKKLAYTAVDTLFYDESGVPVTMPVPVYSGQVVSKGKALYARGVHGATPKSEFNLLTESDIDRNARLSAREGDFYVLRDYKPEAKMNPELDMLFPRLYSRQHASAYAEWVRMDTVPGQLVTVTAVTEEGDKVNELDLMRQPEYNEMTGAIFYPEKRVYKPTMAQNLAYFFNYQLNHMYLRYFMWNFAGRQNDVLNQHGELDAGNWISGIPFIDNIRLGDQSLLPSDLGKNNAGHNRYFMLPLILGLIGLVWQSFAGRRGIEQFWIVFFLFFMTGIAIVLYLNQTPLQPRERDYAFAGSFYAYAIWIGMGVAGLWRLLCRVMKDKEKWAAVVACAASMVIPLQMVSQTWDDHDRSGRYAARDYAINYLESLEPNAIVFCNGDNDTFPLWYAQEVEGVRPDVKIINLSYLASDWYYNQMRMPSYTAPGVNFTARPEDLAYGLNDVTTLGREKAPADLLSSLKLLYSGKSTDADYGYRSLPSSIVTIPVDKKAVVERGLVALKDTALIQNQIVVDLSQTQAFRQKGYLSLGEVLMLDIIATNAANGWERPIYWCSTVGDEYHLGLTDYLRSTGMTHQLVPTLQEGKAPRTDRAYDVVTSKYRWGGADTSGKVPYFDETARRMLYSTRNSMTEVASELLYEGDTYKRQGNSKLARESYTKAIRTINTMLDNLSERVSSMDMSLGQTSAQILIDAGKETGDKNAQKRGMEILERMLTRNAEYLRYNAMIMNTFGASSMTYDSRLMPYQYYRLIELYKQYGGKPEKVTAALEGTGYDEGTLKRLYDQLYNGVSSSGESEYSLEELAEEVAKYAEIVNNLERMSPEEYAATSDDERLVDSMMVRAINFYIDQGGKESDLEQYEEYRKLNRARTERIWSEFAGLHGL